MRSPEKTSQQIRLVSRPPFQDQYSPPHYEFELLLWILLNVLPPSELHCLTSCPYLAARNALKRKKQHEHSLEQTNGQITMLEQQIYSIESANINQETVVAMKNAGEAMKKIHGKMTMEEVDNTMCVSAPFSPHPYPSLCPTLINHLLLSSPLPTPPHPFFKLCFLQLTPPNQRREQLREQHELNEEIGKAITSMPLADAVDEEELDTELEAMEQENLDQQLLKTGSVPVADRLPAAANGPLKTASKKQAVEEDEEEELRKLQAEMAM